MKPAGHPEVRRAHERLERRPEGLAALAGIAEFLAVFTGAPEGVFCFYTLLTYEAFSFCTVATVFIAEEGNVADGAFDLNWAMLLCHVVLFLRFIDWL